MKVFGVYCYKCRHFVYSRARHDYRACKCWEEKKYSGVAIDGGQSDYFKVSQGSDAIIRFLKIDISESEKDLIKDWRENINNLGMIYIENINETLIDYIGAIKKKDLIDNEDYIGVCRNAKVAKWNKKENCFYYIRNKFGKLFIEKIKHPEDDDGFDLFIPFRKIIDVRKEESFEFSDINSEYFLKYPKE